MKFFIKAIRYSAPVVFMLLVTTSVAVQKTNDLPQLTLVQDDRILVFAPHPDDESLGCAGLIQQALAMKLPVRVVWLTNGDNNEWSFILYRHHLVIKPSAERAMGEVRHNEAVAAMKALGLPEQNLAFLGYPDFGTLTIWNKHWGDQPPFKSMLTKVTKVPYANAFRPGAPYKGQDILRDITTNLRDFRPTKVFCSHPTDLNVDHQALYLFVQTALWGLERELRPELHPFLIHCAHWPEPVGLHPNDGLLPPARLTGPISWETLSLSEEQRKGKEAALRAHVSQMNYSRDFMLAFVRSNELFGGFPPVDLPVDAPVKPLAKGLAERTPGMHEELTDAERAKAVGIEEVHMGRDGEDLVVTVSFSKPLGGEVSASVTAFGYREDRPFEQMPKLRVVFGEVRHEVFDQARRLPNRTVRLRRQGRQLTVHIPLRAMGDPQRALTAVHSYLGLDPLDWAEWRVLEFAPTR